MQDRDLGPLGETEFRKLCNQVGITIHKSEMDRTGWDFFVEFPWKQDNLSPQDMLPAPLECKIQVKSTDKQRKRESITLSNLHRLIKAKMPAFYCFIEFDGKSEPQAIYLVHVDRKIIEKTLKKIREIENEENGDQLNKHTLDISYGDADRLADITGKSLKSEIEKRIPEGMEKYIENKNKLLNTLGFEDGRYNFNFTLASDDPIRDILDLSLGIRKEIDLDNSTIHDKRFGILAKTPYIERDGGILSLQVKPLEAELKFKEYKFSSGISFPAKLYISPFNEFIPKERIKLRVESRFFEFIIESNQNINFSIRSYAEGSSLKELKNFLQVMTILEKSSSPIIVEMKSEISSSYPILSFSLEDLPQSLFDPSIFHDPAYNWSRVHELAEMAIEICIKMDIPENEVLINIEELIRSFRTSGNIQLLYQALSGNVESVNLLFSVEPPGYQQGAKAAIIFFVTFYLGNYIIGCCLALIGSLSILGEQPSLTGEKFLRGRQFISTDETILTQELVDMGLNELVEELQNEELAFIHIKK
ncbi:hypothetical protein A0J48_004680 [Sphaerospermopsis aphanizomenoides BCCUSP55]|uniref:hypothetical protein n=1 Tax=Sphaerospermopsis aphanizomenoides TaxID=459663 RepID=UPI001903EF13|nr:hypothetical protein [Sphaerospermopsis aphanizomenoides]MBK1986844.1 hypothetical protein [Sphaerospermopsis aphanizomenoides BCCUSP55]